MSIPLFSLLKVNQSEIILECNSSNTVTEGRVFQKEFASRRSNCQSTMDPKPKMYRSIARREFRWEID